MKKKDISYAWYLQKKWIKNNNLNDIFPENDQIHKITTWAVGKYKVQLVVTEESSCVEINLTIRLLEIYIYDKNECR